MGTTLAVAGLISSIIGTGLSIKEGQKAEDRQKKQRKRVEATNAAKATAAKRRALREERVRRAQLAAQAESAGIGGSSTAISGEALSGTQASEKISDISSGLSTTNSLSAGAQSIADSQSRQQLFSNVASIGSSVFQSAGGLEAVDDLFPTTPKSPSIPDAGYRGGHRGG